MGEADENEATNAGAGVVVVLNRDLMFGSQIRAVLKALGHEARFARDTSGFVAALRETGGGAARGLIDMNGDVDWAVIAVFAAEAGRVPLLGFGPHVDVDGRRAAKRAGVDRIVSRGDFHRDAATLVARYARSA